MTHPSPTALEEKNAIAATDRDAAHVKTDGAVPSVVLAAVKACAASWVPNARLLGNVRAGDIVRAIAALEAELAKAHESASEWEKSNLACSLRIKSAAFKWPENWQVVRVRITVED